MNYTINQIAVILGSPQVFQDDNNIEQLLIDSRKIYFPATALFFALAGPHHDGHNFVMELYKKGVRNFIISQEIPEISLPNVHFIQVPNTLHALQQLAAFHRNQFAIPVIGITGSNGKTIVKELLYQLLHADFAIVRSPKSYNSQLGVPLSIWQMKAVDTLAIFEAGISQPNEMGMLQKMILPTIGLLTFIGDAHAAGFNSVQQKIKEKLLLFKSSQILFYCKDEALSNQAIQQFKTDINPSLTLFSWSKNASADLELVQVHQQNGQSVIHYRFRNENNSFSIPFTDEASIHNALLCCCVLLYLQLPALVISTRMAALTPIAMRLELLQGNNNCSIINDGYSSDINSLGIALDFLQQQQQHNKRTLILSDVLQAASGADVLYQKIAAVIAEKKIQRFIGIGPDLMAHRNLFHQIPITRFYTSTSSFIEDLEDNEFVNETILIKGARVFAFEKISSLLVQKTHQTILEINLNALRYNLDIYRQHLKKGVKLMAMVKAFSYGSGSFEIANVLQHAGADYLAVAYADEGIALRKAGIRLPIMVMNIDVATFHNILKFDLQPEIYSFAIMKSFQDFLLQQNITGYPVHLKLDTGMHRLGFEEKDMLLLITTLKATGAFKLSSVFSHLVASDDAGQNNFTNHQANAFLSMANKIEEAIGYPFLRHIANTSAIARLPYLQLDMVRLGIGLYGVDANEQVQKQLKTVATLKSTIAQIKQVNKGQTVGYGVKAVLEHDAVIATVRIGYADGYRRQLGNGVGQMLVNGHLAPIVGNVCMDMTMIDITGIEANEEDEVIVFGKDLPVYDVAKASQTIPYEILTNISQRVKRIYFEE